MLIYKHMFPSNKILNPSPKHFIFIQKFIFVSYTKNRVYDKDNGYFDL